MKITYFFRAIGYSFSIENVFFCIIDYLKVESGLNIKKIFVPERKITLINFIKNLIFAYKNRNQINHITGDIHYVSLVLSSRNTILTIHDCTMVENSKGFKKLILNFFWLKLPLWHLKYVTAISEKTKYEIVKFTGCKSSKIHVINNPVNPRLVYVPKVFNTIKPNILAFCHSPNKNTLRILESINGLETSITLIGSMNDEVVSLLSKFKINFKNYIEIDNEAIVKLYRECDMLLFPSYYEGFGVPVIEAQATGRVVVTSNIEPMKSIAMDSAHLVDPWNVESIRNGIIEIINNDNYRDSLIEKGLNNVKRFQVEIIAEQYKKIYQKCIKK